MTNSVFLVPRTGRSAIVLAGFIVLCLAAGALGSVLTTPGLEPWYAGLAKPSFNPPNWIFAPVWTTLYVLMGYALWQIWAQPGPSNQPARRRAYLFFATQLVLNVSWSAAFFFLQSPGLGLAIILALLVAIVATMIVFARQDRLAGLLLVPYVAWVGFAAVLNLSIARMN